MDKHDLSGIYIFETNEEGKREPCCIEDCSFETRDAWLKSLEPEALINTCHHLCDTLHGIGEQFKIYAK